MSFSASLEALKHYKKIHQLIPNVSKEEEELLKKQMPVQKIVGFINFDNLQINVNENVLIPRYETAELVHKALEFIKPSSKVLDLCCGSGYIGLTIKQVVNCDVTLSDIDQNALKQTIKNAQINNLAVKVVHSNMFKQINGCFDVIVINPPYIPLNTKLGDEVLKFEPHHALFGGKDGNDYYRIIVKQAPLYLRKNGVLILEMSQDNYFFLKKHHFAIFNDINGKPRIALKRY